MIYEVKLVQNGVVAREKSHGNGGWQSDVVGRADRFKADGVKINMTSMGEFTIRGAQMDVVDTEAVKLLVFKPQGGFL